MLQTSVVLILEAVKKIKKKHLAEMNNQYIMSIAEYPINKVY